MKIRNERWRRAWLAAMLAPFAATAACIGDVEDYDCEVLGVCEAGAIQPAAACSPEQIEETPCGACGITTRVCGADGAFTPWSDCVDPKPGCNPCGEVTWENAINEIMIVRCNRCHGESRSFSGIQPWIRDGSLEYYTERNHFIYGEDKTAVLRWLEIGAPESDCDVP